MRIASFILFILSFISLRSQDLNEYQKKIFSNGKDQLPYRILFPQAFDTLQKYPVIIFLHGALAKGDDNNAQLNIGGRYFLQEENRRNFPAIVIFPQCPSNAGWAYFETEIDSAGKAKNWNFPFRKEPTTATLLVKQLLDSLLNYPFADVSRVYIGGLSQGGMGVFDIIARYPALFAAAFPICGAGKINTAADFAKVALWIFHGSDDDIVPVYYSRNFYRRLKKLHTDVKYSEYPGVRHNSWVNAFGEKDLLPWLFSKSKK